MKKVCPTCSAEFVSRGSVGVYCSRKCFGLGMATRNRARRAERQQRTEATCRECGLFGPISQFAKASARKGGFENLCKPCKVKYLNAWREANPEKVKRYNRNAEIKVGGSRFWKYGLTDVQIAAMFDSQGGRCALCKCERPPGKLVVDHDHKTKNVRGLLCHTCNTGLGKFRDDPALLKMAILYLEATPAS
jgi:hypothetical protein